jgi:hypothetical protein
MSMNRLCVIRPAGLALLGILLLVRPAPAQRADFTNCTFTNRSTANGLGDNNVRGVFALAGPTSTTVYAATFGGLGISTNGGASFTNRTTANGLGSNVVRAVFAVSGPGSTTVYAATTNGLSISTNGGSTFINRTPANSFLGDLSTRGVVAQGLKVYVATDNGLSISFDGGTSFLFNRTTIDRLGSNTVTGVSAAGNKVYAATLNGVGVSTDGGISFVNRTTANGLADNTVNGVFVSAARAYAATNGGLSVTETGVSFVPNPTVDGNLGSNIVRGVVGLEDVGSVRGYLAATAGGLFVNFRPLNQFSFTNKVLTIDQGLGNNSVNGVYVLDNSVFAATDGGLGVCPTLPLPVSLRYVNGRMTDVGAVLGWATAREVNNAYFQIERSSDRNVGPGLNFESIATVPSLAEDGNSVTELTYSYLDAQPLPGTTYYRLIQTDRDGTKTTSRVIALTREQLLPVLFPNPVPADGEAVIEPAMAYETYQISDVQGRIVQRAELPGVLGRVSLAGLPLGVYVLWVQTADGSERTFRLLR